MGWFSKRKYDAETYERDLTKVATKISTAQQKQLSYNQKSRRLKGFLTLYGLLVYSIYTVICFSSQERYKNPKHITALFGVPVIIYVVRYCVKSVFDYLMNSNSEYIKTLQAEQEKLIEDLKQKTNFYSTQALLDRFDGRVAHPPPRKKSGTGAPQVEEEDESIKKQPMVTPEGASTEFTFNSPVQDQPRTPSPNPNPNLQQSNTPNQSQQLFQPQLQPVHAVPYQPQWYDRILDMIAGEDEYSPKTRYALICYNCHNHNGLAPPGQLPEYTIYICPHCGKENGKPQKRKEEEADVDDGVKVEAEDSNNNDSKDDDYEEISAPEPDTTSTTTTGTESTEKPEMQQRKRIKQ